MTGHLSAGFTSELMVMGMRGSGLRLINFPKGEYSATTCESSIHCHPTALQRANDRPILVSILSGSSWRIEGGVFFLFLSLPLPVADVYCITGGSHMSINAEKAMPNLQVTYWTNAGQKTTL